MPVFDTCFPSPWFQSSQTNNPEGNYTPFYIEPAHYPPLASLSRFFGRVVLKKQDHFKWGWLPSPESLSRFFGREALQIHPHFKWGGLRHPHISLHIIPRWRGKLSKHKPFQMGVVRPPSLNVSHHR